MQCQSVCVVQELHALAVACCSAAKVLHDYKLVHRDLRLPNVVQLGREHYMVIDLESVASTAAEALPQDFHNVLKTCSAEALDDARHFTVMSDMFCIGVLLKEVVDSRATPYSAQANRFIRKLLDKDLAAVPALMWLQRERGVSSGKQCHCHAALLLQHHHCHWYYHGRRVKFSVRMKCP